MYKIYSIIMNSGFCVKCRSKKEFKNGTIKTNKKGVRYAQGECITCGTKVNRFLKKDVKLEPVGEKQ